MYQLLPNVPEFLRNPRKILGILGCQSLVRDITSFARYVKFPVEVHMFFLVKVTLQSKVLHLYFPH